MLARVLLRWLRWWWWWWWWWSAAAAAAAAAFVAYNCAAAALGEISFEELWDSLQTGI